MRIFVDPTELAAGELVIAGDEHHYLTRVRRARTGDSLELVDGAGNPLPKDSIDLTASTFDMEPGSTTTDVPFRLDGRLVHCTVHMPTGDPDDVTAECR